MPNVLQNPGAQVLKTDVFYSTAALSVFVINANTSNTIMLSVGSTTVIALGTPIPPHQEFVTTILEWTLLAAGPAFTQQFYSEPRDFHVRQFQQTRINSWYWLTQYDNEWGFCSQPGYNLNSVIAYDRHVPGGGTDPGSGKIVQLEAVTEIGKPNAGSCVLPFASISVGG
jgi:hypothetical protein